MTTTIINAGLHAGLSFQQSNSGGFNGAYGGAALDQLRTLAAGVGAIQCDLAYAAERTVLTAANDDIDLAGVLLDIFGGTLTFAKIVALMIINKQKDGTANTTALTIGGGSNPAPHGLASIIQPGGLALLYSGDTATPLFAVTAATADILRIANAAGATNKYQIAALGRSS